MFDNKTQKELKAQYKVLLTEVLSGSMIDYLFKKADVVFKTEQGFFLEIEKPDIKTRFCFGYSLSRYDSEDYDRANNMAERASQSESYFRHKNLEDLNRKLDLYSDTSKNLYFRNHYRNQKNDIIKQVEYYDYWEEPDDIRNQTFKKFTPVSDNDRQLIIEAYKVAIERFTKRLNTYLKRYGLSKIDTWSYWVDA